MEYRIKKVSGTGTPASIDRRTGIIEWNTDYDYVPEAVKEFIILHEIGHGQGDTNDEIYADLYALYNTAGKRKQSLKNAVKALLFNLNFDKPEDYKRLLTTLKEALRIDYTEFHNHKAKELYNLISDMENYQREMKVLKRKLKEPDKYSNKELLEAAKGLREIKQTRKKLKEQGLNLTEKEVFHEMLKTQKNNFSGSDWLSAGSSLLDSGSSVLGSIYDYKGTQINSDALRDRSAAEIKIAEAERDARIAEAQAQMAAAAASADSNTGATPPAEDNNKQLYWIVGGVVALGLIGLIIWLINRQ